VAILALKKSSELLKNCHLLGISNIELLPKIIGEVMLLHQKQNSKVLLIIICSTATIIRKSVEYTQKLLGVIFHCKKSKVPFFLNSVKSNDNSFESVLKLFIV
jgi:hypothetical protein